MAADKDVVSILIEKDKVHKNIKVKKTVKWNDGLENGKIKTECLINCVAASVSKEKLDNEITRLMDEEGYSEIDATAYAGKASTPKGEVIINNPIYYASKEEIKQRYETIKTSIKSVSSSKDIASNRNSFFSAENIALGLVALGTVAVIGLSMTKSK